MRAFLFSQSFLAFLLLIPQVFRGTQTGCRADVPDEMVLQNLSLVTHNKGKLPVYNPLTAAQ
jgi:hypothetical protein